MVGFVFHTLFIVTRTWNNREGEGEGGGFRLKQPTDYFVILPFGGCADVADLVAKRIAPGNVEDYRGEAFGTTAIYFNNLATCVAPARNTRYFHCAILVACVRKPPSIVRVLRAFLPP